MDLTEQAKTLTFEPNFRTMISRAAKRLLKTRGIEAIIPEPEPPTELGGNPPT